LGLDPVCVGVDTVSNGSWKQSGGRREKSGEGGEQENTNRKEM